MKAKTKAKAIEKRSSGVENGSERKWLWSCDREENEKASSREGHRSWGVAAQRPSRGRLERFAWVG